MAFSDIIGQGTAVNFLRKIIQKNRIPPTLMFLGPEGTGRLLTALTFAKALNCKNAVLDSCDRCGDCIAIQNNVHPNVKVFGRNSSIGINDVRNMVSESLAPVNNGFRVNILDNADSSTIQAFNSMLKYLEEPPDNTVNILIAKDIYNIPVTIRSRSVIVRFRPLFAKEMESFLVSKGIEKERALLASHFMNGSLKEWEKFTSDEFLQNRKAFVEEFLRFLERRSGVVPVIGKWEKMFPELSPAENASRFFDYISSVVKDILLVTVLQEKEEISNIDFLGYIADRFSIVKKKSLKQIFSIIKEQKEALRTNANPKYIAFNGILRIKEVIT